MLNVVQKIHIATGHGGRDKMIKEANKKYANVSKEALELFKELCEECQLKERKLASYNHHRIAIAYRLNPFDHGN
jgi:thiaminase